jgi:site-specific DNA recombinase
LDVSQPSERKTAVGYVRVSSDEQAEGLSLESQESKIREWCDRKDFGLIATFRDEGESAYTDDIAKRPGFRDLLDRLPVLMPTVVVVFSLDRWARSLVVASESFRRMSALGIGFASVTETEFDLSNPASGFMLNMLASFAQYGSAMTAQHVRRVADLKFERGIHRGSIPFGYRADAESTRADPRPPVPDEREFAAVIELFQRALTGAYSCRALASWLNMSGFTTRNRKKSVLDEIQGEGPKPRRFTDDSVQGILTNPFYAGFVVRQRRSKNGTPMSRELRQGTHRPAVSPEQFNRVQSILRARFRAPRSNSDKLRPYLAKGLLRCMTCGEKAWSQHIKGLDYYRESSPFRGIACSRTGRYWSAPAIDHQIETLVRPMELPLSWQQRALELANAENNLIDLRNERSSLEARRRRVIELYKERAIDRAEFDREVQLIDNRLRTTAPADGSLVELSIADFERFGENWGLATPEEKHEMLRCMFESLYVEFRTGQIVEVVPKPGFRWVLEAAEITKAPGDLPSDLSLVIGDPEGIRTPDLHRDRVAC